MADRCFFDPLILDDFTPCGNDARKLSVGAGDLTTDPESVTCLRCQADPMFRDLVAETQPKGPNDD